MKFRIIKKTESGFIIGRKYRGRNGYEDYVWKVKKEGDDYIFCYCVSENTRWEPTTVVYVKKYHIDINSRII